MASSKIKNPNMIPQNITSDITVYPTFSSIVSLESGTSVYKYGRLVIVFLQLIVNSGISAYADFLSGFPLGPRAQFAAVGGSRRAYKFRIANGTLAPEDPLQGGEYISGCCVYIANS